MNAEILKTKRKELGLTQDELAKRIGVTRKTINNYENGGLIPESKETLLDLIFLNEKPNVTKPGNISDDGNLIPLYDDVSTFGSNVETELTPVSNPTEYIDAGTWFGKTKITAAIRHYGESMVEYPNGCILALKEILDFDNVVYGRNYVIETDEIRVTKRIQSNSDIAYVTAYSTNTDTYPDGKQIHEPFHIKKKKIRRISLVIGRIVKEHGSGSIITL